jgi:uncharacterized CHY-type Zn-finger protein
MDYKNCFTCKQELPLNAFNPSSMKYQLKTDKNVMRVCKKCTFFKSIKQLSMIKYNFEIMKFDENFKVENNLVRDILLAKIIWSFSFKSAIKLKIKNI